ncbi:hypothetical protein HRbin11_00618 [bacterium HR11]|nr:hypothetical protein HRbin11_00618 [bacterium HR11]
MKSMAFIELIGILRQYRSRLRNVDTETIERTIRLADEAGDFWSRREVISWVAQVQPGATAWLVTFVNWMVQAAGRRSPWTSEMAFEILKGWPDVALQDPQWLDAVELYPSAIAEALLQALDAKALQGSSIPEALIERLAQAALKFGGTAAAAVVRLIARVYPEDPRWGRTVLEWLNQEPTEELRAEFQRALQSAWPDLDTWVH